MKYVPKQLERTADVSRGKPDRREALIQGIQMLAVLAVLYVALGFAADFAAERFPTSWEARVSWSTPGDQTGPGLERAQKILDRLVAAHELRPLPYRLVLIDSDSPNALAFPGGTIGVTRGLLERVESDQGLAMVIAHELGHHHQRHVLKRLGRVLMIIAPVAALSGDAGWLLADLLDISERRYSRDQEREADRVGLELVAATYGDTEGALEFFEVVLEEEGSGGAWTGFAASHPPTLERVEALRRQARELAGAP